MKVWIAVVLLCWSKVGLGGEVTVAVASNFLQPLHALVAEFERTTEHDVTMTSGSTGQLYAQILNGAPYDILLAADDERPGLLAERGFGDAASVFTYASGQLALWSRQPGLVDEATLSDLDQTDFRWFAIAEPEVAPYGAAARQVLESLGQWDAIASRIVKGPSVSWAFSYVATGNADLGLVALSQALDYAGESSFAIVPPELHEPIRQGAVLLQRAVANSAARAFMAYLAGESAREIIEGFGYIVER